jgi:WD40 repeat protein
MENRRALWGITGGSGLWIVFFLFLVPSPCSALGTESEETDGSIRPVLTAQLGHSGPVYDASFSPNGRFVVTASQDHYVILWDVATGREIRRFEMHTFNVNGARFSPEGTRILSVSGMWKRAPRSAPWKVMRVS